MAPTRIIYIYRSHECRLSIYLPECTSLCAAVYLFNDLAVNLLGARWFFV